MPFGLCLKHRQTVFMLFLSAGVTLARAEATESPYGIWPQWRGPERSGVVEGSHAWPDRLDETCLKLMWRRELGEGYPGPVVSTGHVFTVETLNKEKEVVRAFDRFSGRQLWETAWEGSMKVPFFSNKNGSWVRSTPACDGESLYVAGMRDVLVCLNVKDGRVQWRVDFTSIP